MVTFASVRIALSVATSAAMRRRRCVVESSVTEAARERSRRNEAERRSDQPRHGQDRDRAEDRPLPWGRAAADSNEPDVPQRWDLTPEVERLAVVGEE